MSRKKTKKKLSKKTTKRRLSKKSAVAKHSRWKLLWRFSLLIFGFGLGMLLPWALILNHTVKEGFEGLTWERPSRVYARPLSLYSGLQISTQDLETELHAAAYRKSSNPTTPGSYSQQGNRFRIISRAFEFADGKQASQLIELQLQAGMVRKIQDVDQNELSLVRLDPAEIASIYPLDKQDRELVPLENAPHLLVAGIQAVEDRRFNQHHGVDPKAIARALWVDIREGRIEQGGSTLTQQLVKNLFLDSSQTIIRKLNEAIMAVLMELHFSKSEILEAYINQVYLGQSGAYAIHGFARASRFYFDQPLQQLNTEQVALLIGMVKGASWYNPRRNPKRALKRRDLVLQVFADTGLIDKPGLHAALQRPLGVSKQANGLKIAASGFIDLVKRQLRERYAESDLRREGLTILTTLEPVTQLAAEKAVAEGLDDLAARGLPKQLQAAMIISDVQNGEIHALVGDRVAGSRGFNRALDARRQIGSIMKPLVYLLALEHPEQFNLLSKLEDTAVDIRLANGDHWVPKNYTNKTHGTVSLLDALVHSWNLASVDLGMKFGPIHILQSLQRYGLSVEALPVPSLILGALELTPFEVSRIYQSLASGGYSVPLRAVTAIVAEDGALEESFRLTMTPLQNRQAVAVLNYALTQVVAKGTAKALPALMGRPVIIAGKTGTSNDRKDSWFVGYNNQRLGVVWVGRDDNQPARVTGSSAALRLWAKAFRGLSMSDWRADYPRGVELHWVEPASFSLSDANCPDAVAIPFINTYLPENKSECLQAKSGQGGKLWNWFDRKTKTQEN
ncbi:MAG: penicillin-binding protein 1B [Xanthomonadales bacterium]|nr:penicillin-binding protein 1B [Xanthomonadales bacterium]